MAIYSPSPPRGAGFPACHAELAKRQAGKPAPQIETPRGNLVVVLKLNEIRNHIFVNFRKSERQGSRSTYSPGLNIWLPSRSRTSPESPSVSRQEWPPTSFREYPLRGLHPVVSSRHNPPGFSCSPSCLDGDGRTPNSRSNQLISSARTLRSPVFSKIKASGREHKVLDDFPFSGGRCCGVTPTL